MRIWQTVEKNCPTCHGSGMVMTEDWHKGDLYVLTNTCHCVQYHHDAEAKSVLKKNTPISGIRDER